MVSLCFTMITHGDVQRVIDAFILEETLYWFLHPIERVQTVRGIDGWDGYHWMLTWQMAQDGDWVSLKSYMDTMGETCLREYMEHLIQSAFALFVPWLLDGMPRRWPPRTRSSKRPWFHQNGRGIMRVLAKAAKRYKRMGAKGTTGLGNNDTTTQ